MAVLVVQHGREEGPYAIGEALAAAGLRVRLCRVAAGDPLPGSLAGVEALVITGGPAAAHHDAGSATHHAELALLRAALAAEVPVLGAGSGARLLAVAAGGVAGTEPGTKPGGRARCGDVRTSPAAAGDPLFTDAPERLRAPHRHGEALELPAGAVPLTSCERCPARAFRVGGAAWGLPFHLDSDSDTYTEVTGEADETDKRGEADETGMLGEANETDKLSEASETDKLGGKVPLGEFSAPAPRAPAGPAPYPDLLLGRFAVLVAARAALTATRAFFAPKADTWEARFAADGPRYEQAVARLGLRPGQTALDLGCGTGRALPALRAGVGEKGAVLGVDVTAAMLLAAAREGRCGPAGLLLADCYRLPLPPGTVDGIFTAGLLDHLPDPVTALREWARVTAPGGALLLFHPSGRVERAARHGRPLSPDDPLGEPNLRPMLDGSGWQLDCYEDAHAYFLARAVRLP
ncbi:methyltransferase domain-containing protein [Streptomyces sp. NPDC059255]|uniref:methyltransferase domain-containing protein n=1 Tax=Streptomyces sp. NPDC059255 TaxID=3346793 RepID=UPI0036AC7DA8